ncbi:DinB family protein [Dyella flava]|uniref:DinB family protein n=1 Tax=Dyella flava TaxID=1920170 RepID=A0ABS2K8E4_9GAMM|nr:DinB family protein [Dyella flava]MBM7127421.1 DinB family protein [Dyella flava]GLQ51020.1 DNA damage-inducible protein DinB [Dyella flava]
MSQLQHLKMLTRYRAWADRLLYQSLAPLPEEALTRAQPIIFGSLLRTLYHLNAMDQVWKAHLEGVPHGFTSRNPEDCPAFDALRASQVSINDWYIRFADRLDEGACDETIRFTFIGGGDGAMSRGDILRHVVNHATYHRGHVAMMMYGLSTSVPTTDLPVYLRDAG